MAFASAQFWSKASKNRAPPDRPKALSSVVQLGTALRRAETRAKQNRPKLGPVPKKKLSRSKTDPTLVVPEPDFTPTRDTLAGRQRSATIAASASTDLTTLFAVAAAKKAAFQDRRKHSPIKAASPSPRDDYSRRTLWVGAIPDHAASEEFLTHFFSRYGDVQAVAVRYKPTASKSWALITFSDNVSAEICLDEDVLIDGALLIVRKTKLDNSPNKAIGDPSKVWDTAVRYQAVLETVEKTFAKKKSAANVSATIVSAIDEEQNEPGCCHCWQVFQHHLKRLVLTKAFDWLSLFCVLVSCVSLVLWSPNDDSSTKARILILADDIFVWVFCVEAALKITAFGVWRSEHAYFRNAWNGLDFFICLTAVADFFIRDHFDLPLLRAMRSLRPLRTITRIPSLQVLLLTILSSIPQLKVVFYILTFLFLVAGMFGVQLWMGLFYYRCFAEGDTTPSEENAAGEFYYAPRKTLCSDEGAGRACAAGMECRRYEWNPFYDVISYNSLVGGWIIVFQTITLSNWSDLMYMTMDAGGYVSCVYFIFLVMFGSFLCTNLLIAILKTKFESNVKAMNEASKAEEQRRARQRWKSSVAKVKALNRFNLVGADGTSSKALQPLRAVSAKTVASATGRGMSMEEQKKFVVAFKTAVAKPDVASTVGWASERFKLLLATPVVVLAEHADEEETTFGKARTWLYRVQAHGAFVGLFCLLVCANAVLLASVHHGMTHEFESHLDSGSQVLTICFIVEFAIKLTAMGWRKYFKDPFNCLDAFIVLTSTLELMVGVEAMAQLGITKTAKLLRVLRLVKLINYIKPLKEMVAAVIQSLSTLFWIVILVLIVICVFAVMGMQLFGGKFDFPNGRPRHNYDTFMTAFITVWQIITLTNWETVLFDSVRSWEGSKWPYFYYLAVLLVAVYILFNIFIIIILESFSTRYSDTFSEEDEVASAVQKQLALTHAHIYKYGKPPEHGISLYMHRSKRPNSMMDEAEKEVPGKDEEAPKSSGNMLDPMGLFNALAAKAEHIVHQAEEIVHGALESVSVDGVRDLTPPESHAEANEKTEASPPEEPVLQWGEDEKPMHKSFMLPKQANTCCGHLREKCHWMMQTKAFNGIIFGAIMTNCIAMAIERPSEYGDCVVRNRGLECPVMLGDECTPEFCESLGYGYADNERTHNRIFGCTVQFCEDLPDTAARNASVPCLVLQALSTRRQACFAESYTWIDTASMEKSVLYWLDFGFNMIYCGELLVKLIALGIGGYFKVGWNRLDFMIVITSLIGMLFSESEVTLFKKFAMLRILRPVRLIGKAQSMKMMLESTISSFIAIVNVELLLLFFILIYAIIGQNLFAGTFYDCSRGMGAGIRYDKECVGTFVQTVISCDNDRRNQTCSESIIITERTWSNWNANFDNVGSSMVTIFQLATLQGWTDVARLTIDATAVGEVPIEHNKPHMIVFTLLYVLFCAYFFMNIFVGVIYANFQELKNKYTGKATMSYYEVRWLDVVEMVCHSKPPLVVQPPDSIEDEALGKLSFRRKCFDLAQHSKFDTVIGIAILMNTAFMAAEFETMPDAMGDFMTIANVVFTVIFAIEAGIKILGLGWNEYWNVGWNRFDFFICVVSITDIVFFAIAVSVSGTQVVKVFRLGRACRLC
jgi:hypothetical protein